MSAPSDQAPARASCLPPASARVPEWAHVLGAGSIHRDFGHSVATNAQGDILVAARLERLDEDDQDHDDAAVDTPRPGDSTVDLSGAELVELAPPMGHGSLTGSPQRADEASSAGMY